MKKSRKPTQNRRTAEDETGTFGGLRVASFESRRAEDTERLIRKAGGVPISAPSMRELPLEENGPIAHFADALTRGAYDAVILLTGVGTRFLFRGMEMRHPREDLVEALKKVTLIARGPKPVQALRDFGLVADIVAPEPNTWKEVLQAIDDATNRFPLAGQDVAVQEYGVSNRQLIEGLEQRGAIVSPIEAYRWDLPEDLGPLRDAIAETVAGTVDVLMFTSAMQVQHVLQVAEQDGLQDSFRRAASEILIASVGPMCSEALTREGLSPDIEPERPKLGPLIQTAALVAPKLLPRKSPSTSPLRLLPKPPPTPAPDKLEDSVFLRACRGEATEYTPVWLMRQAGRYMREYREVRARVPFAELCRTPDLAAETAVTAQTRIGADAAILFSDILLILEPMGLGLRYLQGDGPSITARVRSIDDVDRLHEVDPKESLGYVLDAVRATRSALAPNIPLIGFSGAPFTLASYVLEGGGSRDYRKTKTFLFRDEGAWNALMDKIARNVRSYLSAQIDAGCQAVQLFDSWAGALSPSDYDRFVLPHTRTALKGLSERVPVIHFGTQTGGLLDSIASAGGTVLGVDHGVRLPGIFERFPDQAIMGNLDPVLLFTDPATLRAEAGRILTEAADRGRYVFNLGHGVLPGTPVDNVVALVDAVHEISAGIRRAG